MFFSIMSVVRGWFKGFAWFLFLLLPAAFAWAGVGGSIARTVKDSSGAAIAGAVVTETGVRNTTATDDRGVYTFAVLPVGTYDVEVSRTGFKPYHRTGIALDADGALLVDAVLLVGADSESVTVSDSAVHAETVSSQMGEVITGAQMTSVPLNGSSYT